ncbi:MAG: hypothetical protein JO057_30285 [Chloroflexi bacterium]|nr:hypothetical protein [Chloroflexota bacterium]
MNRLNGAFTITSVLVLAVTIERFSFTTTIVLQPFSFIRLHELLQGPILLTLFLVVSTYVLKELSHGFTTLRYPLLALFVVGAYLYGLGEGWHEVTSFTLNQYCDAQAISGDLCGGLFVNDYYTGNVLFFVGAIGMAAALMILERMHPTSAWDNRNLVIGAVNSVIYSFTFFAYAAFDLVLVGLYSTALLMVISLALLAGVARHWRQYPFISYSALAYTLATAASLIVRAR